VASDLKPLQELGGRYFRDSLFTKVEEEREYGRAAIPIGYKRNGKVYYLDFKEVSHVLVLGATRSGKSFIIRALGDRAVLAGYNAIFLTDVKNEFHTSVRPVQSKFHHLLLPNEKPQAMKVVAFRPTFFKQLDGDNPPPKNRWFSFNLGKMSRADFMTLMNAEALTIPQQVIAELIYESVHKRVSAGEAFSLDQIEDVIDSLNELNSVQKTSMKFRFRPLKTSSFYIKDFERDVISLMRQGYVPTFNFERFDAFGKGGFLYPEVTVAVILRTVITARMRKEIKDVFVFVDESSRFVPVDANPSCKRDVMEAVDLYGRYGVRMVFGVQNLEKIPEPIVKQCRYILLPYSIDVGTLKTVLLASGLVRNIQTGTNDAIYLKRALKKYEWVVIDRVNGTREIVKTTCPLSEHAESSS
jgi:hypothetical protein